MRAPSFVASVVQWRWTPSVVLVAGSLAFVGLVVLVVPDDFDSVTSGADKVSRAAARGRMTNSAESVTDTSFASAEDEPTPPSADHRTAALPKRANNIVQSIFHPIQKTELPVEPVDPNPPPPPPEAPLPPPTNTIYTLPTPTPPPPVPPNPLAVPAAPPADPAPQAPSEPQGITGDRQ